MNSNLFQKIFLVVNILYLTINTINAQVYEPIWINYNTDNGLPSSETYEILQDKKGYIWISTDNGLSRFDGYNFKNYGPTNGLKDPVVFHIQEDSEGTLWMNSLTKKIFFIKDDTIKPYKFNSLLDKYFKSHYNIENFIMFKNKLIYESHAGILEINETGNLRIIKTNILPSINIVTLNNKSIVTLELDSTGFGTKGWDFYARKELNINFISNNNIYAQTKNQITYEKIKYPTIFNLNNNTKILSLNYNLYIYKNEKLISILQDKEGVFVSIMQDENNIIYVANSKGKGLKVYKNLNKFIEGSYQTFLIGESASFLFKDRNGGLWVATNNHGIYYAKDLNITQLKNISYKNEDILAISNINSNKFYLGYQSGKLQFFNIKTQLFQDVPFCSSSRINDLFYNKVNKCLYLSNTDGTFFLKNNKWNEVTMSYKKGIQSSLPLKNIWPNLDLRTLVGTSERGFSLLNTVSNKFTYFSNYSSKGKIPLIRTLCAYNTNNNQLLIGTITGLFKVKDDSIYKYSEKNISLNLRIEAINQLKDNTIVVGTKGDGVILIKGDKSLNISEKDGLTSNMVENVYIDIDDNIWVGTLLGLNRVYFDKLNWHVEQLTIHNGLPGNEVIKVESNNGIIWCLTTKGLVRIKDRIPEIVSLPVLISELYINDQKIELNRNLRFTYLENNIRLKLDCLNFKMLGKIPFRFKLKSEDAWRETLERNINLYSLAPGSYDLQIQAKNADGIWSKSSVLSFTIMPPWWKTWQFYLLIILLSLAVIGWFIYLRIRTLKRKLEIQDQMNDLEQAAKKAQMNPHFLFNTLNSVQSKILTGNLEDATHFLSLFGHLVRGVLDMSLQKSISLHTEIEYLKKYLELEQMRFKKRFLFKITVDKGLDLHYNLIAPMLVQPFVENAIIHGISKINQQGIIKINFKKSSEYIEVTIIDNGVGFQYQSAGKSSLEKSVGIGNTKRRLELLDEMKTKDLLKIEELLDTDGKIIGTQVNLFIKTFPPQ